MSYQVVVPISGGKDSQACAKMAVEQYGNLDVLGLFCDTKFEHPETYKHVDKIAQMYGIDLVKVNDGSVEDKCIKHGRFPGGGARHCTEELKIIPSKKFYKSLAEKQGGFIVYYGMRMGESSERGKRYFGKRSEILYSPHEVMSKYPKYLEKLGVMFCLPIIDWSADDVFDYLEGQHNPLYDAGFDRVGCFPCLAGGDAWKEKAFSHDEFGKQQYIKVLNISENIRKSIWTSKGGCQRNNPDQVDLFSNSGCGFCEI